MISKNEIVKSAQHIFKRSRGIPDTRLVHPERDWFFGVVFASVVFLAAALYAGVVFFIKTNENAFSPNEVSEVVEYRTERVIKALEEYRFKNNQFESLRANATNKGVLPPTAAELEAQAEAEALSEEGEESVVDEVGEEATTSLETPSQEE